MGFHEDALFPVDISLGSSSGPGFNTRIIRVDSGAEESVSRWSAPLHQYNIAYGLREYADVWTVREFFNVRRGAANGFRFRDWGDYTSNPTNPGDVDTADWISNPTSPPAAVPQTYTIGDEDQQIGVGDNSTVSFQLVKNYSDGSSATDLVRPIYKPVADTVVVALDGVNQASGWTVDTTTGVVLFSTAPGADVVVTAGFQFDVPVRFEEDVDKLLAISLPAFDAGDIPDIGAVELRTPATIFDDYFAGGAKNFGVIAADQAFTLLSGRVLTFEPSTTGHAVVLPPVADVPAGGVAFVLINDGSESFAVEDENGSSVISAVAAGGRGHILVSKNAAGAKTYYGY